jgi:hypothetical protein
MHYVGHDMQFLLGVVAEQPQPISSEFDWDLVLKALGFVAAVIATYVQTRGLHLTSRTSLKTDLEILKLVDAVDPNYQIIKAAVDKQVALLYTPKIIQSLTSDPKRLALTIFGLLWALGFFYWTFKLVEPGFTWWAVLTGYLALMGLAWLSMGIRGTGTVGMPAAPEPMLQ